MTDFYISKLTITGPGKIPSVVEFDKGLNIVRGPSDTGKSYIAECIDYLLGGDKIRFDANSGYNTFGMDVTTGKGNVSLSRKLGKNIVTVNSSHSDIQSGSYTAKWSTSSKNDDISDVWLQIMGIAPNHRIIKNERREFQRLTVRTFLHMFLVKEGAVLQEPPIIVPVQNTVKTASFSALYFLITGEDFAESTPKEEKKIREARKIAVISYINEQLAEFAKKKTALSKLPYANVVEVQSQIDQMVDDLAKIESEISIAAGRSQSLLNEIYQLSEELTECNTIYNRYQALCSQYSSDIQRLAFIVDGVLHQSDMEKNTTCPFCDGKLNPRKETSYLEASKAELERIRLQLEDLQLAESDLIRQRTSLEQGISVLDTEKSGVEALINKRLKPKAEMLKQSVQAYRYAIEVHKEAAVIGDFETALKADLFAKMTEEEEADNAFKIKNYFDAPIFKALNGYLNKILAACNFMELSSAYISPTDFDAVVNGQAKAMHGKGYRAFLNTIVALSLMEYLSADGAYSPSLLIVDSPILSLKEGVDDQAPDSMKTGLFQYLLENQNSGQVIIIENDVPTALDYSKAHVIEFTKGTKPGRYGLLHGVRS